MAVAARPRKACNQGAEVRALLAAMVAGRHNGHLPPEMDHHLDHHMDHQPHSQQDSQVGARTADAEAVVAEWAQRLAATVEAPGDPNAAAAATAAAVAAAQGEDDDDEEGRVLFLGPGPRVVVAGFVESSVEGTVAAATDRNDVPFQPGGASVTLTVMVPTT